MSACRVAHGLLPLLTGCGLVRGVEPRRGPAARLRSRHFAPAHGAEQCPPERATNAVRSLSPIWGEVGVRGLPVVVIDPNPLTHSLMLRKRAALPRRERAREATPSGGLFAGGSGFGSSCFFSR